jgi:LmbE family N-acetylglucosaminyl deacetylase
MLDFIPKRVLVIVAHPDDVEYFCGGTLALWVEQGCEVSYVVTSSGDKGSNDPYAETSKIIEIREEEQRASANILGVKSVVFLRYADSELNFVDLKKLRGEYVRHIRISQAQVVITHDPNVRLLKQHPDHRIVGQLTMDACFPIAAVGQCYKEQIIDEGLKVVQPEYILLLGTDQPNYWVDISASIDLKVKALQAHQSQESAFHGGIEARLRWKAGNIGKSHGVSAAEEYLIVRTGPTLPDT